ncbi:type II toxin-antitoxin system VapC family toxin [Parapedobacter sp.]
MNLLLDTHALIWYITDNHRLPAKTRSLIEFPENNCFVSLATYWEMAIKNSLGRLDFKKPIVTIFEIVEQSGFEILPINVNHILRATSLPFHHYDPFDRMIIGQAIADDLSIVTKDEKFPQYEVNLLW